MRITRQEKQAKKAERKAEADIFRGFRLLKRMAENPNNEAFRRVIANMKKSSI